jgi:hypothetical protein
MPLQYSRSSPAAPLDVSTFGLEHDGHLGTSPPLSDAAMSPLPEKSDGEQGALPAPSTKKLCVRHQRMADEGTNLKLQQVRKRRTFR